MADDAGPSELDASAFNERLFFPRRDATKTPAGALDLDVPVPGARLHLRWHRAEAARATVLLFHGNSEVVSDYDDAAVSFARVGCALAVVDYRGYGRSSGTPSLRGIIEDAPLVLDRLRDHQPGAVIVMGRSLGSACAAELYGRSPASVEGFILESGFVDLDALVARRGRPPVKLSARELSVFDPLPKLARGGKPLLVLHGALDDLIAPAEADIAFANAGAKEKSLVFVEGRGHNDLSESPRYWEAIERFATTLAKLALKV